jgi:pimeloyl-ACP methyl ester carboxylesterase
MPSVFVPGRAGQLHVDDGGPASPLLPVLFVHGLGGNASHWAPQLRHLRRTRRAAALDLRGHGRSELGKGAAVSILALADDVMAAADGLGLRRFALAGFSIGASIAGCAAGRHPERVAGLFLVDPASAFTRRPAQEKLDFSASFVPPFDAMRASILGMLDDAQPAVRQKVTADFDAVPREVSAALLSSLVLYDAVSPLQRFAKSGPILTALAAGQRESAYRLGRFVPGVEERVVEGTSHWVMLDAPDELQPLLDGLLRRLEPDSL